MVTWSKESFGAQSEATDPGVDTGSFLWNCEHLEESMPCGNMTMIEVGWEFVAKDDVSSSLLLVEVVLLNIVRAHWGCSLNYFETGHWNRYKVMLFPKFQPPVLRIFILITNPRSSKFRNYLPSQGIKILANVLEWRFIGRTACPSSRGFEGIYIHGSVTNEVTRTWRIKRRYKWRRKWR